MYSWKCSTKRILIVDPDNLEGLNLDAFLKNEGFAVDYEPRFELAEELARERWYTQIILLMSYPEGSNPGDSILGSLQRFPADVCKTLYIEIPKYVDPSDLDSLDDQFYEINARKVNYNGGFFVDDIVNRIRTHFEMGINKKLVIVPSKPTSTTLAALASWVEEGLDLDLLNYRVSELDHLFRRYFKGQTRIELSKTIWKRGHRICCLASLYTDSPSEDHCLIVVTKEQSCETISTTNELSGFLTRRTEPNQSTHYSLVAFTLSTSPNPNELWTLLDLHQSGMDKAVENSIPDLFIKKLPLFEKKIHSASQKKDIHNLYQKHFGLGNSEEILEKFVTFLAQLGGHMSLSGPEVTLDQKHLTFSIPELVQFRNPLPLLASFLKTTYFVATIKSAGDLHLDNLLVDNQQQIWLSDCTGQGTAPPYWNAVTLESDLRFGKNDKYGSIDLFRLEQAVNTPDLHIDLNAINEPIKGNVQIINEIRRCGYFNQGMVDENKLRLYLAGLLYHALANLIGSSEKISFCQFDRIFASLAGLAGILEIISPKDAPEFVEEIQTDSAPEYFMTYDKDKKQVFITKKVINMRSDSQEMLVYCLERKNGDFLSYKDLRKTTMTPEKYKTDYGDHPVMANLKDVVQHNKEDIETAIKKVFPNPDFYFFELVWGKGYRFYNPPKKKKPGQRHK